MLKYIGNGRHSPGIPAQDLDDDTITRLAGVFNWTGGSVDIFVQACVNGGLYEVVKPKATTKSKKEVEPVEVEVSDETD